MRQVLIFAAIFGLAQPAPAAPPAGDGPLSLEYGVYSLTAGRWTWGATRGMPGIVAYSNTDNPTTFAWPKKPGVVTGDDLLMTQAGRLSELWTSLFYRNPFTGETLTYVEADIRFWDGAADPALDPPLAGLTVTFDLSGIGGLEPEEAVVTGFTDLAPLSIDLPATVIVTITYHDADVSDGRFGQLIYDPPTVGSSQDRAYKDDPGSPPPGWYTFGSDPVANLYWKVVLAPVDPCAGQLKADSDCNGGVDAFDIDPFVLALTDPAAWEPLYPCDFLCVNDINRDGKVDGFDIDPFVTCLLEGCP